jgi:hypothetical protein
MDFLLVNTEVDRLNNYNRLDTYSLQSPTSNVVFIFILVISF